MCNNSLGNAKYDLGMFLSKAILDSLGLGEFESLSTSRCFSHILVCMVYDYDVVFSLGRKTIRYNKVLTYIPLLNSWYFE